MSFVPGYVVRSLQDPQDSRSEKRTPSAFEKRPVSSRDGPVTGVATVRGGDEWRFRVCGEVGRPWRRDTEVE